MAKCFLEFDEGTLLVRGDPPALDLIRANLSFDPRVNEYRAPAFLYEKIMRILYAAGADVVDLAKNYAPLPLNLDTPHSPMPHQENALRLWKKAKCRGVVVMPTGSGKTFFAFLAMRLVRRPALVVVPTIELMQQWAAQLENVFHLKTGMLGGGSRDIRDLTVSTYDSAVLRMNEIGNRFGLIVFDECHHLPGEIFRTAASMAIAPYRLGLTATPECPGDGEAILRSLIGDTVSRVLIEDLEGTVLAPYVTERILVPLAPDEQAEYDEARTRYLRFVRRHAIDFTVDGAWRRFLILCARKEGGRDVLRAWIRQREIARCGRAKLDTLWKIIRANPDARTIVFTADNDTAYRIGEAFCFPVLTHHTKAAERKDFLESFRSGAYPVLVTSRVLNEGVDVPEASVAIVVSGSAGTREHIQRLGRILRRGRNGKQARLYELVSAGTSEMGVSCRRRNNSAYTRKSAAGRGPGGSFFPC